MGDNRLTTANDSLTLNSAAEQNAAAERMRSSLTTSDYLAPTALSTGGHSTTDSFLDNVAQYKLGRVALVTAEGVGLLPQGIWNGVKHNVDNPWEFAGKMGMAAAFGVGMRVLLPKAGAAKALAGTVMSYFMVRDAAAPVYYAWKDAWDDQASRTSLHLSAQNMANGLGLFAVDTAAGLPVGMAADWAVGKALTGTAGGRRFEAWKEDLYTSDKNPVGRFFNWSEKTADRTTDALSKALERARERRESEILSIDEKLRRIQENLDHHHAVNKSFPEGVTPEAKSALDAYLAKKKWHKQEMPGQIDTLLGENRAVADGVAQPGQVRLTETANPQTRGIAGRMSLTDGAPEGTGTPAPKPADTPTAPVAKPTAPAEATPTTPVDSQAQTVGRMATIVRDRAAQVTAEDMQVAGFREAVQSPLTQNMREGTPPLDKGHYANNKSLVDLADQLQTPEHIRQAGFLLDHHRVANVQMGIPEKMPEIVDLNQYSRSIHKNMMDLLRGVGIKPEQVLRGTNSPIFLIHDSGGAGPYTIPAIKGVTDTAVIVLPREYAKMLGVHVAGIYPHELGHDLVFGDLLRFPENLRDKVLSEDVVRKAMSEAVIGGKKGIADIDVEIPGHGTVKKSELFTQLLRAQANENTADMFGTSIDPNTGLSLATLLASLRKAEDGAPKGAPGKLETRSMYGKEFVDEGNPMGFEVHGIDRWRLKLGAETLRQLSNGDAKVGTYAASLDRLADSMSRPGNNYVWANMDTPGKFVSIPIPEWDAMIPAIVRAQMDTPLPALHNQTWRSVLPNMAEVFPRVDGLADGMAAAARNNATKVDVFNPNVHKIENVYSAGLSAWMKAIAENPPKGQPGYVSPEVLLTRINDISSGLTAHYRDVNFLPPEIPTSNLGGGLSQATVRTFGAVSNGLGRAIGAQPQLRAKFAQWAPKTGIYAGVALTRDMYEQERLSDLLKQQQQQKGN